MKSDCQTKTARPSHQPEFRQNVWCGKTKLNGVRFTNDMTIRLLQFNDLPVAY